MRAALILTLLIALLPAALAAIQSDEAIACNPEVMDCALTGGGITQPTGGSGPTDDGTTGGTDGSGPQRTSYGQPASCGYILDAPINSTILAHGGKLHVCGDYELPTHIIYQAYGTGGIDCERADGALAGDEQQGELSVISIKSIPGGNLQYQVLTDGGWTAPSNAGEPAGAPSLAIHAINLTAEPPFPLRVRAYTTAGDTGWQAWNAGEVIGSASETIRGIRIEATGPARPDYVSFHGEAMCEQLVALKNTGEDITYTCAVEDGVWRWETGSPSYEPGDPDRALFDDQGIARPVTCHDSGVVAASIKYSPPPTLEEGYCALQQCWNGTSCVEAGTRSGPYYCEELDGEGRWISAVSRLAEELLRLQNNDFLLNCGPQETTINNQQAPSEWGYCTLVKFSGDEVTEIILGVALNHPPDSHEALDYGFFNQQVKANHPEFNESDIHSYPYVYYNESTGTAYFSTDASKNLSGAAPKTLWQIIKEFFGVPSEAAVQSIQSMTAEQLFIRAQDGNEQQYFVEWKSGKRTIIAPSMEQPYDDTVWREVIHDR